MRHKDTKKVGLNLATVLTIWLPQFQSICIKLRKLILLSDFFSLFSQLQRSRYYDDDYDRYRYDDYNGGKRTIVISKPRDRRDDYYRSSYY